MDRTDRDRVRAMRRRVPHEIAQRAEVTEAAIAGPPQGV